MKTEHLLLTDRNTKEPVLVNMAHVIGAWSVPGREDHTTLMLNAIDGQGRTRELSVSEKPEQIHNQLQTLLAMQSIAANAGPLASLFMTTGRSAHAKANKKRRPNPAAKE